LFPQPPTRVPIGGWLQKATESEANFIWHNIMQNSRRSVSKPLLRWRERKKRDFIIRVAREFRDDTKVDFDVAISAASPLLDRHISRGESIQVRSSMKEDLRALWPAH